jgi:hypothetical protein
METNDRQDAHSKGEKNGRCRLVFQETSVTPVRQVSGPLGKWWKWCPCTSGIVLKQTHQILCIGSRT